MRAFFFKTGGHLFARRAVDALVGDTAFPMTQEAVFLGQGPEAPPLECIGPKVGHSPLYFTFGENRALQIVEVSAQEFSLSHTLSIL